MNRLLRSRFLFALLPLVVAGVSPCARANILVYEGFTGYTTGTRLDLYKPNANTIGLDRTVTYYDGSMARTANYTLAAGLSFGSLVTSGGALAYTGSTNVIGADIDIGATPFTGTLWTSYLTKITAQGSAGSDGSLFRVGDSPSDTADIRYTSWADSRSSSTNVAVSYASSTGANGTGALVLDTTYIIISRFTGVGTGSGVATLWALTESQFADFLLAGGSETVLNGLTGDSVTATASHTNSSGTRTFETGDATSFVTVNGSGLFDELRIASSLADVIPTAVPEPAMAPALAGLAGFLSAIFLRRRR